MKWEPREKRVRQRYERSVAEASRGRRDPDASMEGHVVCTMMFGAVGLLVWSAVLEPSLWGFGAGALVWQGLALAWYLLREREPGGKRSAGREGDDDEDDGV